MHNTAHAMESSLQSLGRALSRETTLCLIGSSVGMLNGQPGRMTSDIDVWAPESDYDTADLAEACHKSGVCFDPTDIIPPDGAYMQMIKPGIVMVGKWRESCTLARYGKLTIVHPPVENVIASKLVRGEPQDIEDVVFLMARFNVTTEQISAVIDTMSGVGADIARENMVFLDLCEFPAPKPNKGPRP